MCRRAVLRKSKYSVREHILLVENGGGGEECRRSRQGRGKMGLYGHDKRNQWWEGNCSREVKSLGL